MIELVNKKSNVDISTPTIVIKEEESVDLSNYYTKAEVDAKIPDVSGYQTEEQVIALINAAEPEIVNDVLAALPTWTGGNY